MRRCVYISYFYIPRHCGNSADSTTAFSLQLSHLNTLPPKEAEKVRARHTKAISAREASDDAYQESVKQLEDARIEWEQEHVSE